MFNAQLEAQRLGENYVSSEHLLLGLIMVEDCLALRVLQTLGVTAEAIRAEIERHVTRGDSSVDKDMQLTPRAKRIIDLAYDEARQLDVTYIGAEHLLLGMLREAEGLAGRMLAKLGIELEPARLAVMASYAGDATFQEQMIDMKAEIQRKMLELQRKRTAAQSKEALREIIRKDAAQWSKRSLVTLWDVTAEQIRTLLHVAAEMKTHDLARETSLYWEYPRTLAMLFEKPSLRTRVSFEVSMAHLEGHAIYLAPDDVGLGKREAVADVAGALSRWVDAITARVFKHDTVVQLAQHATIPVINALSDREHPVQAFADLLTLQEQKGELGNRLKLAYVGDGNNVLHALLLGCAKLGIHLSAGCPDGFRPDEAYVDEARRIGAETGAQIEIVTDPVFAVRNADAVYTDVWTSMGQEAEREARVQLFAPYQVNSGLLAHAKPDAIVLHCLPAHRGEEIADDVMETHKTVILDEAENRLHTQKALLVLILGL